MHTWNGASHITNPQGATLLQDKGTLDDPGCRRTDRKLLSEDSWRGFVPGHGYNIAKDAAAELNLLIDKS